MAGLDNLRKYIDAGAATSLEPYMQDAPNFNELFADQIPYWRSYSDKGEVFHWEGGVGGKLSEMNPSIPGDIAIRSDVLEALG